LTCANSRVWALGFSTAQITISVINEDGQPIEGARVGIGFEKNAGSGTKEIPVVGYSDAGGHYTGFANANNFVGFNVKKDNYYMSTGTYQFREKIMGRWEPWNPEVTVVLRKIEKPVPMYARDTEMSGLELPAIGLPIGFDLIEYDWVAPYGLGKAADIIFKLDKKIKQDNDFDCILTMTFSNKLDGILLVKENRTSGSVFKLPRNAPKKGYDAKFVRTVKSVPGQPVKFNFKEDNNYIFRVRSEQKNGKLLRAMYGKIHGDIKFEPRRSKTAQIGFKYYLNPDYTDNLEYDSKHNLFENLKTIERVGL
jgi:hypothetical protein